MINLARAARKKEPAAIFHVMSRSISEFDLFPEDSDKEFFLDLLKSLKEKYFCKIYCYCLMSNHYHIVINPCGFDISKFMKSLNQRYVRYINNKYERRGHLLAERFNSKIIKDDEYMLTVSAYIHNNPKDIPEYNGREYDYPYSSMGIYLYKQRDKRDLVDTTFLYRYINGANKNEKARKYEEMVVELRDEGSKIKLREYLIAFVKEQHEYKPHKHVILRDKKPDEIVKIIAQKLGFESTEGLLNRWRRKTMEFRRIVAYVLNTFCGMGINKIAKFMHNITASCCSKLVEQGWQIMQENKQMRAFILQICK